MKNKSFFRILSKECGCDFTAGENERQISEIP